MTYLCFDTETTGFCRKNAALSEQPYICQLGLQLRDHTHIYAEVNLLIKPDGWLIPDQATKVHGITDEVCLFAGVPIMLALSCFQQLARQAQMIVAHNIGYDIEVLQHEFARVNKEPWFPEQFCTMKALTNICKLPGQYGRHKWPTLTEAHQHCFSEPFDGAHDAMADVRACGRLFEWLNTNGHIIPKSS